MRQSQHGKKPRGRGRKPHSPLSRVYDSSGPDVKIRGTASHIAEKYVNLARDAQSSGDRIAAENYLQHAEHYYRIIAAAQAQMGPINAQPGDQPQQPNEAGDAENAEAPVHATENAQPGETRPRRGRRRGGRGEAANGDSIGAEQSAAEKPAAAEQDDGDTEKRSDGPAPAEFNGAAHEAANPEGPERGSRDAETNEPAEQDDGEPGTETTSPTI